MKSLFLRLLVTMWLSMALLGGIFALIHANAFPKETLTPRRRFMARVLELRAEQALRCQADQGDACEQYLVPLDRFDDRIAVYRSGALIIGEPVADAEQLEATVRNVPDRVALRTNGEEVTVVVPKSDPEITVMGVGPERSRWLFFIGPETLPYRLAAIVLVTGFISFLFARYLSRPLRILRQATQRMAGGDLSVRVVPRLRRADGETLALGKDMDRMSERIEALLNAQRRLLRDVSHELRSPLARLAISLELVRRRSGPENAPALDRIERETERLNSMIGELLSLSRLEAENTLPEAATVDIEQLVLGVVEDAALEAEAREVTVLTDIAASGCGVEGHGELLRRAIENVVRNAVRFSDKAGKVEVQVTSEKDGVRVSVRDHGPGVPEDSLCRIFEPFFRVESDRARTQGGTGIGLAITQRALAVHGGQAVASNAVGGGLLLTLRIPRRPTSLGRGSED